MDKKGGKDKKKNQKEMKQDLAPRLNNKTLLIESNYCKYFMDSNNNGDLFLNKDDRTANQKWEFFTPDVAGEYFLKNVASGFYLASNDYGDLFTDVQVLESSFQRWKIHQTTDPDNYTIVNKGNDMIMFVHKSNKVMMQEINPMLFEDLDMAFVFTTMARKAVKK